MPASSKSSPDPSSPLERVLDLTVYGPIGLAITARKVLPQLVEAGRRQVESQLTLARTLGRLAVNQGSRQGGDVLRRVTEQAETVLVGLGLVPDVRRDQEAAGDSGAHTNRGAPAAGETATATVAGGLAEDVPPSEPVPGGLPANPPEPAAPAAGARATAATGSAQLPIPGYDTLSASQVVQRLPGLTPDELEAVRLHEVAGRSRKTVLLKVAQLRQGS